MPDTYRGGSDRSPTAPVGRPALLPRIVVGTRVKTAPIARNRHLARVIGGCLGRARASGATCSAGAARCPRPGDHSTTVGIAETVEAWRHRGRQAIIPRRLRLRPTHQHVAAAHQPHEQQPRRAPRHPFAERAQAKSQTWLKMCQSVPKCADLRAPKPSHQPIASAIPTAWRRTTYSVARPCAKLDRLPVERW